MLNVLLSFNKPNQNKIHTLVASLVVVILVAVYWKLGMIAAIALTFVPFALVFALRAACGLMILFILFTYFRLHEAFPFLMPFKIPKLLALSALMGIGWHLFITRKLQPSWHTGHAILCLVFVWMTLSMIFASNRGLAMAYWSGNLTKMFIMVFAISWWLRKINEFNWVRLGIMLSGVSIALVALHNKANGIGLVEGSRVTISRELRSQIGDPNDLSLVLLFPVSFLAAEVFCESSSKFRRCLALVGLITVISGVIATQSRGGLLGICAVLGLFIHQKLKNPIFTAAVGGAALMVLAVFAGISDRQSGGAAEDGVDESAMGRIYAWQAAFNMALANPLTGVGIDNFFSNYFFFSPHWDGKNHAVHSTWFQVLAEMGFVGLVIFIIMLVIIFRTLRRVKTISNRIKDPGIEINVKSLIAGLTAFCVSGTFLTQAFNWPIYIILAMTIALDNLATQLEQAKTDKVAR